MLEIVLAFTAAILFISVAAMTVAKNHSKAAMLFALTALVLAGIEVTDVISLYITTDPFLFKQITISLESLLPLLFLSLSLTYLREGNKKPSFLPWGLLLMGSLAFPLSVSLISLNDFFYAPDLQVEKVLFLDRAGYWFYIGVLIYMVLSLLNIETTFASSSGSDRWRMKFEIIGTSTILAVFIFYFSQGLLYRTINMNLVPMRSAVLMIAAGLIAYSKLFRGNNIRIAVSRHVIYRSLTLTMVGGYLLFLGLLGEGLRYMGVGFSKNLTIFIAFVTGIAVCVILFSGRLRRKMWVSISKHFFRHKYDYRDEWLKFTDKLAACKSRDDVENAILGTFCETFGLRSASLYLLNMDEQNFSLTTNRNMPRSKIQLSLESPLIQYFCNNSRVVTPANKEYAPTKEEELFFEQTGASHIVPLLENSRVEGFLMLGEQLVHEKLIYEDYDLMKTLARQACSMILNLKLSDALSKAREMEAVGKISAFVAHDLKNLISTLSLIVENANEYIDNPEFQLDLLQSLGSTVSKMKMLMARLKNIKEKGALNLRKVDLRDLCSETVKMVNYGVSLKGDSAMSEADSEEMQKVILNLVLNALEATDGKGIIEVETGHDQMAYIKVIDDGPGMPEDFVKNHLFKPFVTTKKKGLGIGLYQCMQIIEAHRGKIEVESSPGKGAVFTIYLPLAQHGAFAIEEDRH